MDELAQLKQKVERYELGIDKIFEEIYDLNKKIDDLDILHETVKVFRLKYFQNGLARAIVYMTGDRKPRLKKEDDNG